MTVLNCGREVGEIVDMYGDQEIVIGESVNDAYALEEDQEWWWESVPCKQDGEKLTVYEWSRIPMSVKREIIRVHGSVLIGEEEDR